tara:strand:- start:186 stop:740 length:555 start_codon:yes stop_codon:yes gene_type:complete
MDNLIKEVFVFRVLPDIVKEVNKIKLNPKNPRYDIVGINAGGYNFIEPLVNNKNQCNITLQPTRDIVSSDARRKADLLLSNSRVGNLTSLYHQSLDNNGRYYGNTNPNRTIKLNGKAVDNPMLAYKDDLLLIDMSGDRDTIIVSVVHNSKHLSQYIYPEYVAGAYDTLIKDKLEFLDTDFGYSL